jgi:hypothetical protein
MFPKGVPNSTSLCFAQSPPLLTYIGGPKGEALHLSIESSILGASVVSTFFCDGPIKISHCKKKELGPVRHPQLISINHTRHPQYNWNIYESTRKPVMLLNRAWKNRLWRQDWKDGSSPCQVHHVLKWTGPVLWYSTCLQVQNPKPNDRMSIDLSRSKGELRERERERILLHRGGLGLLFDSEHGVFGHFVE